MVKRESMWGIAGLLACACVAVAACSDDGKSASVTAEAAGANCPNGGVKVQVGDDTPTYVCNGTEGTDGSGATVTSEAAGANCANGGVKVQVGTGTPTYVCNPEDGVDGRSVVVTAEAAGANCANGGVRVQVETDPPAYVCDSTDGVDGEGATVTPEAPGTNCADGGVRVQVGTDAPSYVCSGAATKYTVYVIGHLSSADMAANKTAHDNIVAASSATVTAAGDERHLVFLGLAGASPGWGPQDFLAVDVWNNLDGLNGFLTDPNVQAAFGSLFDAPPVVLVTTTPSGFSRWGALEPKRVDVSGNPFTYAVLVRGTLAERTPEGRQAAHNQVAIGGKATALALGDYAHLPTLEMADSTHFVNIDLWDNAIGMSAFLADPNVGAAFGRVFDAADPANPLTFGIYTTSDFAQY
ncbi:MAG: hypothetical protein HYV07_29645 [Deltaproteobacteria bacterium]|nr:hypothetical protein [Deltaproteobacteria bacterium]